MKRKIKFLKRWVLLIIISGTVIFCACSKFSLVCGERDLAEQAGINHFQQLIEITEQYKKINGEYPKAITDINQNVVGTGQGFPNKNITGASYAFKPQENYFDVKFYFDRERTCLIGNNRACEYTSTSKKWSCY